MCHDELVLGREVVDGSKFFKKITEDDPIKSFFEKNFLTKKIKKCDFWHKMAKKSKIFEKFSKKIFFSKSIQNRSKRILNRKSQKKIFFAQR